MKHLLYNKYKIFHCSTISELTSILYSIKYYDQYKYIFLYYVRKIVI